MLKFWERNFKIFQEASQYAAETYYLNPPEIKSEDTNIARYCHGISHGVRTAFSTILFINLYRKHGHPETLKLSEREIVLAAIYAIFHDSGRKSDRGQDLPEWEAQSFQNFKKYLLEKSTDFNPPLTEKEIDEVYKKTKPYVTDADCLEILRVTTSMQTPFYLSKLRFYNVFNSNNAAIKEIQLIISVYRYFLATTDHVFHNSYLSKIENKAHFENIHSFDRIFEFLSNSTDPNIVFLRNIFDLFAIEQLPTSSIRKMILQYCQDDVHARIVKSIYECNFYTKIVGQPLAIQFNSDRNRLVHEIDCIFRPEGKKVSVSMTGFGSKLYGVTDRYFVGYAVIPKCEKSKAPVQLTDFYCENANSGPTRFGFREPGKEEKEKRYKQLSAHLRNALCYNKSNECFATIHGEDIGAVVYFAGMNLYQNIRGKLHALYAQKLFMAKGKALPILEYSQHLFFPIPFAPSKEEILSLWRNFVIEGYNESYVKTHKNYKEYIKETYKELINSSDFKDEILKIIDDVVIEKEETLKKATLELTGKNLYELAIMFNNAIDLNNFTFANSILKFIEKNKIFDSDGNTFFHLNIFSKNNIFCSKLFPTINIENLLKTNKDEKTAIDIMIEAGYFSYKIYDGLSLLEYIMPKLVEKSSSFLFLSKNYVKAALETAINCENLDAINIIINFLERQNKINLIKQDKIKALMKKTHNPEITKILTKIFETSFERALSGIPIMPLRMN